jgi:hypothetical protein
MKVGQTVLVRLSDGRNTRFTEAVVGPEPELVV